MERLTYRGTETMTEDRLIRPSYSDYSTRRIIERLAEYEDLEEQGLLLRLPCKVGDTVYTIYSDEDTSFVEEPIVKDVSTHRIWIENRYFDYSDIGKTVFLTQAEAEQKLKEMESD